MIPYRLLFISETNPPSPDAIHSSNQMITWGLWTELSKLPHVTLSYYKAEPDGDVVAWKAGLGGERVDFTLVHSYAPSSIFGEMSALRMKTNREVMWISELACSGFDYNFTFLPCHGRGEQMPLPALRNVLAASMEGVEKFPNSVLLDHHWSWQNGYAISPNPNLWCARLYEWLEPLKNDIVIGQMESLNHERQSGVPIPDWVRRVPNAFYPEYLRTTAPYENFVMTHPGTYEHSTVDMAARGIRVLVPYPTITHRHADGWEVVGGGDTFAPKDTVNRLLLPTFSSREELFAQLNTPFDGSRWGKLCTDTPEGAAQVDSHCQKVLNGR